MKNNQKGFTVLEIALSIVLIGLAGGVVGYVVSNIQKKSDTKSSQVSGSTPQTQKKSDTVVKSNIPELVEYPDGGVTINKKSDTTKLKNAGESFKLFIESQVGDTPKNVSKECPDGESVNIKRIFKDEFAKGGVGSCEDGAAAIWKKDDNTWKRIWAGQTGIECSEVAKFVIPHQIASQCIEESSGVIRDNVL